MTRLFYSTIPEALVLSYILLKNSTWEDDLTTIMLLIPFSTRSCTIMENLYAFLISCATIGIFWVFLLAIRPRIGTWVTEYGSFRDVMEEGGDHPGLDLMHGSDDPDITV